MKLLLYSTFILDKRVAKSRLVGKGNTNHWCYLYR